MEEAYTSMEMAFSVRVEVTSKPRSSVSLDTDTPVISSSEEKMGMKGWLGYTEMVKRVLRPSL